MLINKIKNAQTVLEYVLMISAVTAVMVAMSTFLRRSAHGMIKMVADQVGVQQDADQKDDSSGYLVNMTVRVNKADSREVQDRLGEARYTYDERADIETVIYTNMGSQ